MKNKTIRAIGTGVLTAIWGALILAHWFGPDQEISTSERRPLAGAPVLSAQALLDGSYMTKFDTFAQDQFPLRDSFRSLKALFHTYALGQTDNNGYAVLDGVITELSGAYDPQAVASGTDRFQYIYDHFLKDQAAGVYVSVIPDKAYFLEGYPTMDYEALFEKVRQDMPWATYLDITEKLSLEDYYRTDTHWRQENIQDVATLLVQGMNPEAFGPSGMTQQTLERPFYGVYYGQAAMPVGAEPMNVLTSGFLDSCKVTGMDAMGRPVDMKIYNEEDMQSNDLYDIFLSGTNQTLVTVENPNALSDRELVLFRDSFGCSIAPLMVQDYAKITLVDIRTLNYKMLPMLGVQFENADVLFLYSTLVLNNPDSFQT